MVVKPIEDIVVTNTCPKGVEKKARPQKEQALNCPRRYWTEGGSLRNIPVGGGSRKNKRSSSSSTPNNKKLNVPDLVISPPTLSHTQNPKNNNNVHQGQDLNLAFPATVPDFRNISELVQQNNNNNSSNSNMSASVSASSSSSTTTTTPATTASHLSAMELLSGITSSSTADPNSVYTCGFPLQDFKPTLNFSLDGYASLHNVQSGRLLFPFEDLKQVSNTTTTTTPMDQKQQGDSTGYWTGMLGGGSW
uniref:Dof zinc finger protein DOF4.6 n=1 Tax=Cajanus cajan TaxID=3821 RepID=A0A151RKH8_CAJCA|nr:Dof zinc finger protein DOF4.6 [Cajanus cajan]